MSVNDHISFEDSFFLIGRLYNSDIIYYDNKNFCFKLIELAVNLNKILFILSRALDPSKHKKLLLALLHSFGHASS